MRFPPILADSVANVHGTEDRGGVRRIVSFSLRLLLCRYTKPRRSQVKRTVRRTIADNRIAVSAGVRDKSTPGGGHTTTMTVRDLCAGTGAAENTASFIWRRGKRSGRWGRVFGRESVCGFVPCERRKRRLMCGGLITDQTSNADRRLGGEISARIRVSETCPVRAHFAGGRACVQTRVNHRFVVDVLHLPQFPNRPRRRKTRQTHASAEAVQKGLRRIKTIDSRSLTTGVIVIKQDTFEGRANNGPNDVHNTGGAMLPLMYDVTLPSPVCC